MNAVRIVNSAATNVDELIRGLWEDFLLENQKISAYPSADQRPDKYQ